MVDEPPAAELGQGYRGTDRVIGIEITDGDISAESIIRTQYGHVETKTIGGRKRVAVIEAGIDELRQFQEGVDIGIVDDVFQRIETLDGRIRVAHDNIQRLTQGMSPSKREGSWLRTCGIRNPDRTQRSHAPGLPGP